MSVLRVSVAAVLALSTAIASAQSARPSIEERLQQLEAEQAAMRQQLAERDKLIGDLRRELEAQHGQDTALAAGAVPTTDAVPKAAEPPGEVSDTEAFTPEIETWGVYDPGTGFRVARTDFGELDISAYAMARYMNQNDDDDVFIDHLGNTRPVDGRNDIFSHRIMVFVKGWLGGPKLIYNITLWTVNTTDQDAIFANLGYQFSKKFSLYAGLSGNPGSRSLTGSHPYWLAHDRVMADEFFRPFFGSGIYATGEALPGLWYNATVANNSSALGVKASQLDRKFTYGGTVWWMPTTHEFGPRGGYGDWEWHERLATRFGISYVGSAEQSFRSSNGSPENTTLRLADSVNLFETGSLAPGVTIDNADYRVLAIDAALKYEGIFLQAEYYQRWLDNFDADGPLPVGEIKDNGFYVQAAFYPVRQKLELYGITSQIYGDDDAGFGDSSEYGIGMNWYPYPTRNHRLNVQLLDVNKSPVSSTFGYYTGGQDGWTLAVGVAMIVAAVAPTRAAPASGCLFNDAHFHLTNYVQQGTDLRKYVDVIMGDKVCRSTVFGIPLQQTWSYENSGDFAPTYYLQSDAPLYYYSFTDAYIARVYQKLNPVQQQRLDPMITGFNPADMYAVDHIRRVLELFPGVFTGIGEFTIHKEFVSSKVAGDIASLTDPALDRVLEFAGEVGLVVILHSDIDMPFAKAGAEPVFLKQMKDLLRRHPKTKIIWAHIGLGRVVQPVQGQASAGATERNPAYRDLVEAMITDPTLSHVYFDISWDEVAKYAVSSPESIDNTAAMLNEYPERFLFGTDNVAPADQATQLRVYGLWDPIWRRLTPEASRKVRLENYERLFDAARTRVRAWEAANVK